MFAKSTGTPILKPQSTHDLASIKQFQQNTEYVQKLIDDMLTKYHYMDEPIKAPSKPTRPPSESPTIDQILHTLLFE